MMSNVFTNPNTLSAKGLAVLLLIGLCLTDTRAQTPTDWVWWNPAKNAFPVIEGQGWPTAVKHPYDRLPAIAETEVRPAVWSLGQQSAGLLIRFRASTDQIVVRYTVQKAHAMPHMPATGVSGLDLYAIDADGNERWCLGKYSFKDTLEYRFVNLNPNDGYHKKGREYRLYLPLYNAVSWLEIGVPNGSPFTPLPIRPDKPIVVYGTSIAQGGCASRPGMAWPAILGRKLDRPVINLGFSGNGRMEKEIIQHLAELDAKLYVLDCLPNLVNPAEIPPEVVVSRTVEAVRTLRQKRPDTPILLVEHAGYTDGPLNAVRQKQYTDANAQLQTAIAQLRQENINGLYVLRNEDIHLGMDDMVDGTHPTDLGMQHYADAYEKSIRPILNELVGVYSTTQPRTQFRDAAIYDWETRHRAVDSLTRVKPPNVVFMGNSITHYWGGLPKAPISRGTDSWEAVLAPLGTQNFGYGWDRIENVLWRVYHGELDGYAAAQVVLMIGTNNLDFNSDAEIVEGLRFLTEAIRVRQPKASVLVVGVLPRRGKEARIRQLNQQLADVLKGLPVTYANPGTVFLTSAGTIDESLFTDGLHPNANGYQKLAGALRPYLPKR